MKNKCPHKHYKHFSHKWKRLAIAFAGAALMSTAMLPGLPMAAAHASPVAATASTRTPQKSTTTNRSSEKIHESLSQGSPQSSIQSKFQSKQSKEALRDNSLQQRQTEVKSPTDKNMQKIASNANKDSSISKNTASTPTPLSAEKDQKTPENRGNTTSKKEESRTASSQSKTSEDTPSNYKDVLDVTATAYAPGPHDNDQWGNKTYSGTQVRPGVIAVDPKIIPLGSQVYIKYPDGHGVYATAEDTGGAIKGNRIDIAKSSVGEAEDFGIQNVKVYVLDKSKNK